MAKNTCSSQETLHIYSPIQAFVVVTGAEELHFFKAGRTWKIASQMWMHGKECIQCSSTYRKTKGSMLVQLNYMTNGYLLQKGLHIYTLDGCCNNQFQESKKY